MMLVETEMKPRIERVFYVAKKSMVDGQSITTEQAEGAVEFLYMLEIDALKGFDWIERLRFFLMVCMRFPIWPTRLIDNGGSYP